MKKIYPILIFILILSMMPGCTKNEVQTLKIAVMGDPDNFYTGYKEGVERAVKDLKSEYSDSGYDIECEFYNDNSSYEQGSAIIDELAADKSITAVIGSMDMDINKTAAHVFDEAEKLFIVPYFLYDSVYEENYYDTVFSLCNSAKEVGEILRRAAAQTTARRWAICAADGEFERSEMNGFLRYSANDGIQTVDCVSVSALETNFDEVYKRWEALGVEGVIIFPNDDEGFEILKKLKRKNPALICGGDTAFDNSSLLLEDEELMKLSEGFIMADEFTMRDINDDEILLLQDMANEYYDSTGVLIDTWYFQAYNAVRMAVDTAIQNDTADTSEIARILHENGYSGFWQEFSFEDNGMQRIGVYKYSVYDENGIMYEHNLDD